MRKSVRAVEEEHVQMGMELQVGARTLHDDDGAALSAPHAFLPQSLTVERGTVLSGAVPLTRKIHALHSPSRRLPPQVRVFVELLMRDAGSGRGKGQRRSLVHEPVLPPLLTCTSS